MNFNWAEYFYWFYSALAQSLAAFLGVIGVFAIFRLQIQHSLVENSFSRLRNFMLQSDPRWNELKISSMNFKELLKHSDDLNNFWANRCINYERQIRKWESEIEAGSSGITRTVISQNINRNNDIILRDRKFMAEMQFLKTKCIHGRAEKGMISSRGFYIAKHICAAFAFSIVGLYSVKELVSFPSLSNLSRFATFAILAYVFFIGIEVMKFFKRCLKGDFFEDAFKDVERRK